MKKNGKPSKREIELAAFRIAGYHDDKAEYTQRMISRRTVSTSAAREAWNMGVAMRKAGTPCGCVQCEGGAA